MISDTSATDGPRLYDQIHHGEVLRVSGCKSCTYPYCCGGNEAVRLMQRDSLSCVITSPHSSESTFSGCEVRDP